MIFMVSQQDLIYLDDLGRKIRSEVNGEAMPRFFSNEFKDTSHHACKAISTALHVFVSKGAEG